MQRSNDAFQALLSTHEPFSTLSHREIPATKPIRRRVHLEKDALRRSLPVKLWPIGFCFAGTVNIVDDEVVSDSLTPVAYLYATKQKSGWKLVQYGLVNDSRRYYYTHPDKLTNEEWKRIADAMPGNCDFLHIEYATYIRSIENETF